MEITPTDARITVRLAEDLISSARQALGLSESAGTSEVIRTALCAVSGADIHTHARLPVGGDVRTMYGHREGAAA